MDLHGLAALHERNQIDFPFSGDAIARAHSEGIYAIQSLVIPRHNRVPWCETCQKAGSMTPSHDPSNRCFGGRKHCTCGTCY